MRDGVLRSIWFGMRCEFTRQAIVGATGAGSPVVPVAIVLPHGPQPQTAGWPEPPLDRWLRERDIAIVEVDRLAGDSLAAVHKTISVLEPVLGVGACFPFKVPASLRDALPCGVLNIHPALLPALRGPEPVFHAFRLGLDATGVTVHVMDAGWDSGPIVAQERVPVPDTGTADELEAWLARRGGEMLARLAPAWCAGEIEPVPQDDELASWAPVPDDAARTIPASLTVAGAARFLAACGPLFAVDADSGERVLVVRAVSLNTREYETLRAGRSLVRIACADGVLWAMRHGQA